MKAELTQSGTVLSEEGDPGRPRSLDQGAANAMKPKRVLELGQRIREEGSTVVLVGAVMNIIVCVIPMLLICLLTSALFPSLNFTPWTFTTIYLIAYVLILFPSCLMANSMMNEDVAGITKQDENLIRELRLPLLEWAVKNDCVDKIEGLDVELSHVMTRYIKAKYNR
ncbi:MAG: hypothetical protein EOP83_01650 [Verrucomicrobiaceae bacterium]|nr:MAG: hypothetical protein EOP83_01650 [Verrucomicrobiaceae bacterium]